MGADQKCLWTNSDSSTTIGDRSDHAMFKENPVTREYKRFEKENILHHFPQLERCGHDRFLYLGKYLSKIPEKCYSRKAFSDIYSSLVEIVKEKEVFLKLYNNYHDDISIAFRSMYYINSLPIHDNEILRNSEYRIFYCENTIHPNLLKIIESVYSNLISILSAYLCVVRNKEWKSLDIFNRVEVLKTDSRFFYLTGYYDHTMRNAIAHGDVLYKSDSVVYKNRGETKELIIVDVLRLFDELIDICNGLCLGYRLFFLANDVFLGDNKTALPIHVYLDELREEIELPHWKLIDCLESQTVTNQRQLNIFVRNNFLDRSKVHFFVFHTAVLAEDYLQGYGRYFISLDSKYSFPGFAAFNGVKLRDIRLKKSEKLEEYKGVLEDNLVFFYPVFKVPRICFTFSSFLMVLKIQIRLGMLRFRKDVTRYLVVVRNSKLFNFGHRLNVESAIVLEQNEKFKVDIRSLIRREVRRIVRRTVKLSIRGARLLELRRFLPLDFVRIHVFSKDLRKRTLGSSGLIPELICRIETNKKGKVKQINYIGGSHELIGNYIVFWNNKPIEIH
jgi:hypothetical protein